MAKNFREKFSQQLRRSASVLQREDVSPLFTKLEQQQAQEEKADAVTEINLKMQEADIQEKIRRQLASASAPAAAAAAACVPSAPPLPPTQTLTCSQPAVTPVPAPRAKPPATAVCTPVPAPRTRQPTATACAQAMPHVQTPSRACQQQMPSVGTSSQCLTPETMRFPKPRTLRYSPLTDPCYDQRLQAQPETQQHALSQVVVCSPQPAQQAACQPQQQAACQPQQAACQPQQAQPQVTVCAQDRRPQIPPRPQNLPPAQPPAHVQQQIMSCERQQPQPLQPQVITCAPAQQQQPQVITCTSAQPQVPQVITCPQPQVPQVITCPQPQQAVTCTLAPQPRPRQPQQAMTCTLEQPQARPRQPQQAMTCTLEQPLPQAQNPPPAPPLPPPKKPGSSTGLPGVRVVKKEMDAASRIAKEVMEKDSAARASGALGGMHSLVSILSNVIARNRAIMHYDDDIDDTDNEFDDDFAAGRVAMRNCMVLENQEYRTLRRGLDEACVYLNALDKVIDLLSRESAQESASGE